MDSEIKNEIGSFSWFWNELEVSEDEPWNLSVMAEKNNVTDFQAIITALMYSKQNGWLEYSSLDMPLSVIEKIVNEFILYYSRVPYVGRTMRTQQPIACLEGKMGSAENKLAYWQNGAVYSVQDVDSNDKILLIMLEPESRKLTGFPTPEELIGKLSTSDGNEDSKDSNTNTDEHGSHESEDSSSQPFD
jgi:hypothetical protein